MRSVLEAVSKSIFANHRLRIRLELSAALVAVASLAGCSSSDAPSTSSGGSTSAGGSPAGAGRSGSGSGAGSGGSLASSGGTTSASGAGSSGAPASSGAPSVGGSGGASAGSHPGGASSGGMPGGSGSGSGGAATTGPAKPSAGCGSGGRPSGGQVQVAKTSIYMFPEGYDGTKPFPLLIALHACGNPNTEFVNLTNGTPLATDYVRSFPNTPDSGQCWSDYKGDVARIIAQYDEVMSKYCIDQNRVFAIAHSSGAQMLVNILSHQADAQHLNLKGVSPVAADPYKVALPMPVLYIDGQNDMERGANSAKDAVALFRASNSCMATSKPYASVMSCTSTDSGHPMVDPGCITYDGCAVPTIWCSHNDPSYNGTEHGVPCFAIKAMSDFFKQL